VFKILIWGAKPTKATPVEMELLEIQTHTTGLTYYNIFYHNQFYHVYDKFLTAKGNFLTRVF